MNKLSILTELSTNLKLMVGAIAGVCILASCAMAVVAWVIVLRGVGQ